MFKKIVIGLVVVIVCAVGILFFVTENAAKLTEYDLSGDKVASVNEVIGEARKVTGVTSSTSNGVRQKQYTYESESVAKDLITYTTHLRNNGWIVTQSYDLNAGSGEAQLAKESTEAGKIFVLSIAFESNRYAIKLTKMEGQLTRK